jgi:hypothetical protein
MKTARGTFDVELPTLALDRPDPILARRAIRKRFTGDLVGTSFGEMLSALPGTPGSGGYVALEKVEATLDGRSGSFVLQHFGTMERGAMALRVAVVPDSGTGDLVGLHGELSIAIEAGQHFYSFAYDFRAGP